VFENKNLRTSDCLHALCQPEAENFRRYGLKNPICIIPNGIDVPEIGKQKTENRNLPVGRPTLNQGGKYCCFFSRIHPKKGLVNLLKAWKSVVSGPSSAVSRQSSDWLLAIAGWEQGARG